MKVYTIYKSEDGLNCDAATNGKALYELILATNYNPQTIEVFVTNTSEFIEIAFNYPNLLRAIRCSKGMCSLAHFTCIGVNGELRIQEVNINS